MKVLIHLRDNLIVYVPFFLIYALAGTLTHHNYLHVAIIFIGLTIVLTLVLLLKKYLEKRSLRKNHELRWRFLSELSPEEQFAIRKQHEVAKLRGLWSLPELDNEIKQLFLESKKVKIKVTRGYNLFCDDGAETERDIFYHCIFHAGKNQKREIELLLHFPCFESQHTLTRARANKITPERYVETLFEVIKTIKSVTKSSNNKNEITVKFYNDYEIKWRYYIFEEKQNDKKTLFFNYYDDKKSGADSSMLKIEYGESNLCQDFDRRFDTIFNDDKIAKEIVSNTKGDNTLITSRICNHTGCETKIKAIYCRVFQTTLPPISTSIPKPQIRRTIKKGKK